MLFQKDTSKAFGKSSFIIPAEKIDMIATSNKYQVKFKIININFGWKKGKGLEGITYINANYLIKLK